VSLFERLSGRPFSIQYVPEDVLKKQQEAATDQMQQSFSALQRSYANGDPIDPAAAQSIWPKLTTVAEYAEKVLGQVPARTN
jgi:hypothetical protein